MAKTVRELMALLTGLDPDMPVVGRTFGSRLVSGLSVEPVDALRVVSPWGEVLYDLTATPNDHREDDVPPAQVEVAWLRFAS